MKQQITKESVHFITQQYLDYFLSGISIDDTPLTNEVSRITNEPQLASHLCTPRFGYYHHGLYIGDGKVIHYSGLADGLRAGPVEIIQLKDFQKSGSNNKGFEIIPHPGTKLNTDSIIKNAYSRLHESNYNLLSNNCEHFVHECIYGFKKSKQVSNVLKVVARPIVTPIEIKRSFTQYLAGEISGNKFREEISDSVIKGSLSTYSGILGQAAIPIPGVGFLIGAGLGVFIGNTLLSSGHISLGESSAVKAAKERRQKVEHMCRALKAKVQESQSQLEEYFETYFSERRETISNALLNIETSNQNNDLEQFDIALTELNELFGRTLKIKGFQEFNDIMLSDKSLSF